MTRPSLNLILHPRTTIILVLSAVSLVSACSTVEKPLVEAPPQPVAAPTVQMLPPQIAKLPPPQIHEVQDAVRRVFKESVVVDTKHEQTFIVGDFNGDLSQDLAVVLRPASNKLAELNEEYPGWMLRDLAGQSNSRSPRLRVTAEDELLAIIHGYEANGWRDPQATQTYLLKNAAGRDLRSYPAKEFIAENKGKKMPQLHGDLVGEELRGKSGYLYYSRGTYAWYDPKNFNPETARRAVHMTAGAPKQ